MPAQHTIPLHQGATASVASTNIPAIAAALLGLLLIWGVGFSPIDVMHNTAHDTRHSVAFPCH